MSIFVPKSSTATRYKEVFGAKMRTYELQVAGSISTQGGRIGVTADIEFQQSERRPIIAAQKTDYKACGSKNSINLRKH